MAPHLWCNDLRAEHRSGQTKGYEINDSLLPNDIADKLFTKHYNNQLLNVYCNCIHITIQFRRKPFSQIVIAMECNGA
jgi:hypothetical protein